MNKDDIGDRGQWLFALLMTDLCERTEPHFRPRFLGDKFPTFDFIVELVDNPELFFFVQVKTTSQGYTQNNIRLKVQVSQADVDRMVACPAPTYVVGIDTINEVGFLLSVNEPRDRVTSLTTKSEINCAVLERLANEVRQFWSSRDMVLVGSHFKE